MPRANGKLIDAAKFTKGRVRSAAHISQEAFEILERLTTALQDIKANESRVRDIGFMDVRNVSGWVHFTPEGEAAMAELLEKNRYDPKYPALEELNRRYKRYMETAYAPGAATNELRCKFPATYCAGDILSELIIKHGPVLQAKLDKQVAITTKQLQEKLK